MLTHLSLSNFKSWQTLDMPLARVTGLFGTNSSGKSSILQFLLMLKQTKDATDRGLVLDLGGQNQLVNLGSYKSLIYKHDENLSLKWAIKWTPYNDIKRLFDTSVEVVFRNKEIKVQILTHKLSDDCFFKIETKNSCKEYEVNMQIPESEFMLSSPIYETISITSPPIKTHLFPEGKLKNGSVFNKIKDYTTGIEYEYEDIMNDVYYLAPLREYPQREYQWRGSSPSHVGYRGENTIHAILAATIRNETQIIPESNEEKPFQEVIAYWLKKLGLIHEFKLKEIAEGTGLFHAIVKKEPESTEAFLTDVGFGVSQVLPALVLLYYVPEGSIILMEQPEIHLHPSVQSGLADVILQVSKQRDLQVIVESHSEHLLRRFQRRVAEEQYSASDLKLYFCNSINGESILSDLELNEFGEIMNWPENFFGNEMAEIAATRKAAIKRKIQEASKNE
jgi:predicted ATPase